MNTPWRVCPDCGWNFEQHGDTHKWRFHCKRAERETIGIGEFPPTEFNATGTMDERSALWQMDEIKTIMAEQGLNFGEATNVFVTRHHPPEHSTTKLARQAGYD